MKVIEQEVHGFTLNKIPEENETIADDINISELLKHMEDVCIYLRPKEDCPFNRGNYIVDVTLDDGEVISLRYPIEMKEDHFKRYIAPLVDALDKLKRDKMN